MADGSEERIENCLKGKWVYQGANTMSFVGLILVSL